jgi:hypothetical protein
MADDTCNSLYPLPAQRKRFMQVVKEILEAEALAKETGKKRDKARVELELPHEMYAKLKVLAQDYRVKGRKAGVTKLIEGIINQFLRQKGL